MDHREFPHFLAESTPALRWRVGFSANHTHIIDKAIEHAERIYQPRDLDLFGLDERISSHCWEQWHIPGTLIDTDALVEAVPPRTRDGIFIEKRGQIVRVYEVPVDEDAARAAYKRAIADIGTPYGYAACAATYLLLRLHLHDMFRRLEAAHLDCSQRVSRNIRGAGIDVLPGVRDADTTPLMVEAAIRRLGWRRVDTSVHAAVA